MKKVVLLSVFLGGCTVMDTPANFYPEISATFDPAEVAWAKEAGSNTITGNAVLRTVGGDAKTCAGLEVNLVPMSSYAKARFDVMYGGLSRGILPASINKQWSSTDPRYVEAARRTRCDSQGNFIFERIPDGQYYVTAMVVWGVPQQYHTSTEGGVLMEKITVSGGETKRLILTV